MPQDFAKKPRKPSPSRKTAKRKQAANNAQVPAWIWLLTGTVLGAFIMFLVYLSDINPKTNSIDEAPLAKESPADSKTKPKVSFDFYEILKESEIEVNKDTQEHYQGPERDPIEFTLQVGSFKNPNDADRVRAELLLLNLSARAEKVTLRNGNVWHRVLVGPFTNPSKMEKARSTLVSNNFEAFVFKRKIKG